MSILANIDSVIIVCDTQANIIFFNKAAENLFNNTLSIGESLYSFLAREPVEHAISMAHLQTESLKKKNGSVQSGIFFQCAIQEKNVLCDCRVIWFQTDYGSDSGFTLFINPASHSNENVYSLHNIIEQLRAPLANLRAAAENLASHPDLSPVMQSAFENIILQESTSLSEQFEVLAKRCQSIITSNVEQTEILSTTVIDYLIREFNDSEINIMALTNEPYFLLIDNYSLYLLLRHLVYKINTEIGIKDIAIDINRSRNRLYLDIIWQGKVVTPSEIDSWLQENLLRGRDKQKVNDILKQHDSDLWSLADTTQGKSLLRIPLTEGRKFTAKE